MRRGVVRLELHGLLKLGRREVPLALGDVGPGQAHADLGRVVLVAELRQVLDGEVGLIGGEIGERLRHAHLLDQPLRLGVSFRERGRGGGIADGLGGTAEGDLHPGRFLVRLHRARRILDRFPEDRLRLSRAFGLA